MRFTDRNKGSNGIRELSVHLNFTADHRSGEWGKPAHVKSFAEHTFETLPRPASSVPDCLFLQVLDPSLVVPNGLDLNSKHDDGEDGEKECFKHQTD